jgi:hypothetical protein
MADWRSITVKTSSLCGIGSSPPPTVWVLVPEHYRILWGQALTVERRELAVCEEVAQWS